MGTALIIIVFIILAIVAFGFYLINARRPKFFKGSLKPLEKSLFEELQKKLPPVENNLLKQQLEFLRTGRGCRLHFPKSYSLELYEDKNNPLPGEILFNRKDEFKLATISFVHAEIKYKVEFNCYNGRICGFTVRPGTKKILRVRIADFEKYKLNNDPAENLAVDVIAEYYNDDETFEGILHQLKQEHTLTNVKKPLDAKHREVLIKRSETKLPVDFIELCLQANGFVIDGEMEVRGLNNLQIVSLEDDNYLILAEKGSGCLTVRQSKRTTKLYFHSYEDQTNVADLGNSFIDALHKFMQL